MESAPEELVLPYVKQIQRLVAPDGKFLRWASDEAFARSQRYVLSRSHAFAQLLRRGL